MSNLSTQICPNGHASPVGSNFCNTCGQSLVSQTAPSEREIGGDDVELAEPMLPSNNSYLPNPPSPNNTNRSRTSSKFCSGCGEPFQKGQYVCESCQTIRPLSFDHYVDPSLFQWSLDGQAMSKLRSIKPLVAVANQVSKQVGRPWIEANFNGVRLNSRQMPNIYSMAVQAARILGLRKMPSIYVSGVRPWDAMTFGSNDDAFIVIGSALVSCFQKSDLMFLFAREMGHIVAGHALWKTVIQFCVGEQNAASTMMRNGIAGLLDPFKLIESAVELPLIAWARQAEITADRAGLLASAGLEQARRTMMMWSLRSPMLYRQINIDAWLQQQAEDTANANVRLAEVVSSSTPYLTRRIKLLQDFNSTAEVHQFRKSIMNAFVTQRAEEKRQQSTSEKDSRIVNQDSEVEEVETLTTSSIPNSIQSTVNLSNDTIRFACPACKKQVSVLKEQLKNKSAVAVQCPNQACQKVTRLAIPKNHADSKTDSSSADLTPVSNESLSQMSN